MALPTCPLTENGIEVTQLGYGSMGLRGPNTWGIRTVDDPTAERILNQVLDLGINFIDTAPDYGIAEERIGRFIGSRRNEFFLATKCGCTPVQHDDHLEINHVWKKEVVEKNLQTSLKRMRTDRIDLLQFHGGDADTLVREGLVDQLKGFRDQGLIRYIGVSSKSPLLDELIDLDVFDTIQVPYSCLAPEHDEVITRASEKGIGVIVRGGVAHGGPDAAIQRDEVNRVWEEANLEEFVSANVSRAELILRFTLSHPGCSTTIVGTANEKHLKENVASAAKGPLEDDLVAEIKNRVSKLG
ncbi:General stress protein 69 [Novipirellula aureliae]|uniref:General stress protein 69 n=1 Tax=Novipirellula aureliae TaxID=2527966 RepID=A0A5C6E9W6_9BACT|nr:aldo/keto reductase [Novipirellula aureliae]TWU45520.1 General stress protein 69 [Novipirellula aureliae]